MKTYHFEYTVVAAVLCTVAILAGNSLKEWLCAVAVLLEFGEATVVDRLLEDSRDPHVLRHRRSVRKMLPFAVTRETIWVIYFILVHSYSAIVGCVVFLLYPLWRKLWRTIHPREPLGA